MKEQAESTISDEELAGADAKWGKGETAWTKEAVWIRKIFDRRSHPLDLLPLLLPDVTLLTSTDHFPTKSAASTAVRWIPRADWGMSADPSGRAVKIHDAAYAGAPDAVTSTTD